MVYRSREVFEARRLTTESFWDVAAWTRGRGIYRGSVQRLHLDGHMTVGIGDWVVKTAEGFRPYKHDDFERAYEPAH